MSSGTVGPPNQRFYFKKKLPLTSEPLEGSAFNHIFSFGKVRQVIFIDVCCDRPRENGISADTILSECYSTTLHQGKDSCFGRGIVAENRARLGGNPRERFEVRQGGLVRFTEIRTIEVLLPPVPK